MASSRTEPRYDELPVMKDGLNASQEWVCPEGHFCTEENYGSRCETCGTTYNDKGQRVATEDDVVNGDYRPTENDPEWMREMWEANHGD